MMILSKSFDALTLTDIQQLITDKIPENNQLEYKGALSASKGIDPWENGKNRIGDKARNELLEELVAFANAQGGILFLGIAETNDGKGIPERINPIRQCEALIKPLELQIRDCIEPKIHTIQIKAIQTNNDGKGVLLFNVQKSRSAPHRLKPTKECYIRRNDRSEKMSMIEIQDYTLLIDKGMDRVEAEFKKQQETFNNNFLNFSQNNRFVFGIKAVIVPVYADIYIDKLYNNSDFFFPRINGVKTKLDNQELQFDYDFRNGRPTPIIRGVRFQEFSSQIRFLAELYCNGTAQVSMFFSAEEQHKEALGINDYFGMVINAILLAHQYKVFSGFTDIEYGLEIEIKKDNGPLRVCGWNDPNKSRHVGDLSPPALFPRYSIQNQQNYNNLMTVIYRDFWNAAGLDRDGSFTMEWSELIRQ